MFLSNDYDKALDYYMRLRNFQPNSKQHFEILLNVIKHAKIAISRNNRSGDAHILLANAYYLAALSNFPGDNYSRYLPLAAAVIYHWRVNKLPSNESANGERIFLGVSEGLEMDIPEWMNVALSEREMSKLHEQYYDQAII